jgi:hypothetical protein
MGFNSFDFANSVINNILGNLKTLEVGTQSLNIWTDSTADLTSAWQTGDSKVDPLIDAINKMPDSTDDEKAAKLAALKNFIDTYENLGNLGQFSVKDTATLLTILTAVWPGDGSGTGLMSAIQTYGQLVSAQKDLETSTGETESKAEGAFIQQLTSAQQPVADMGTAGLGIVKTLAGVLAQNFV